jgi:hypothetical protein
VGLGLRKGGWAAEPGRRGVAGAHQRRESVARSAFGPAGGCSGRREALFANPRRGCAGDMVPRQSARQAVAHRIMALGRSAALAVARPMPYRQEGALRHINQGVDFANLSWPGKIRPASPPPGQTSACRSPVFCRLVAARDTCRLSAPLPAAEPGGRGARCRSIRLDPRAAVEEPLATDKRGAARSPPTLRLEPHAHGRWAPCHGSDAWPQ